MSYSSQRMYYRLGAGAMLVAFPIALIIFAFSSCNLRKRSEKKACKAGEVQQCLYVGKYYEDKLGGIISFLMSHADTSVAYYFEACKLKSATGCERMMDVFKHGEQAKNLSTERTDMADALINACAERVTGSCDLLEAFMGEGDWVATRSARAFEQRCDRGSADACYRLGALHAHNLGGLHNITEEILPLYEKACAAQVENSCELAQAYRDVQASRAAQAGSGSGSDGSGSGGGSGSGSGSGSGGGGGSGSGK